MFNDGIEIPYNMDWSTLICHIKVPIANCKTVIGIYADRKYINDTLIYLTEIDKKTTRVE